MYLPAWKMRDVVTVAVRGGDPGMGLSNGKDIPIKGGAHERGGERENAQKNTGRRETRDSSL